MLIDLADLFSKASDAYTKKNAFVLYRKPNETIIHGHFQHSNNVLNSTDFSQPGFVFAPFQNSDKAIFFDSKNATCFQSEFSDLFFDADNSITEVSDFSIAKENHIAVVNKAIEAIKNDEYKKVVLSRKETLDYSNFNLQKTFYFLLKKYPSAMVYSWYHPEIGFWMGATPELLFKVANNQFATMALAGTQVANKESDVHWSAKEIAEQQLVTDFIVDALKSEIKNIEVSQTETVKAGNLWHIKTSIKGVVSTTQNINTLLNKLHPTPAVCGMPKEKAMQFILDNEIYNREFYTGYLGTINENQHLDLYVNLRCMKIENTSISIYIGGGITEQSNAVDEWLETVAKASTMKNVLF